MPRGFRREALQALLPDTPQLAAGRGSFPTQLEEHENFTLLWSTPKEMQANWELRNKNKDYDHWIYFLEKSVRRAKELGYDTTSA